MEELQELVDKVSKASSQFGLSLNPSKTKVMKICRKSNNDEEVEVDQKRDTMITLRIELELEILHLFTD